MIGGGGREEEEERRRKRGGGSEEEGKERSWLATTVATEKTTKTQKDHAGRTMKLTVMNFAYLDNSAQYHHSQKRFQVCLTLLQRCSNIQKYKFFRCNQIVLIGLDNDLMDSSAAHHPRTSYPLDTTRLCLCKTLHPGRLAY